MPSAFEVHPSRDSRAAIPRSRRALRLIPPARLAGILLLLVWLGPVTFAQTDGPRWLRWLGAPQRASAFPRTLPAGQAIALEPGTALELRLTNGATLKGRFLGRDLLGDSLYARRFAARSRAASFAPLALGETLHVALRDGRAWTLPFAGYGELALLLRAPDRAEPLRVPFEFASEIRRADGEPVEPKSLARAFRKGKLPSAEAIVLEALLPVGDLAERWEAALRVPAEDVRVALAEVPSGGGGNGSAIAGGIVLGVVVGLVLFAVLITSAANSTSSGCQYHGPPPQLLSDLPLTTRPFDLERGCYENDVLMADVWPEADANGPAMALADREPSPAPAR